MAVVAQENIQVLDSLAERIGPRRYQMWFKQGTSVTLGDDRIVVSVPNRFVGSWLESHYANEIAESAKQVLGRETAVSFEVDHSLPTPDPGLMQRKTPVRRGRKKSLIPSAYQPSLRGELTDFVVGPPNQLAFQAAQGVAHHRPIHYNPLFIHGGCGLGKTHLLQGICNELKSLGILNWCYLSGEEFTNQYIEAIQKHRVNQFRKRFRSIDVLVIDDIHFLANKTATQQEFLHTYNAIEAQGKQVVLASDAHPKMMGKVCEKLVSRFVCGMVVKIDSPDRATRQTILRQWAQRHHVDAPQEVLDYVAGRFRKNVRELEGAMVKLTAFADVCREPLTASLAIRALDDHIADGSAADPGAIVKAVLAFFGVTSAEIRSSKKAKTISLARSIAMYLVRKECNMSFPEVGRVVAGKGHAIALQACRRVEKYIADSVILVWQTGGGKRQALATALIDELTQRIL